MLTCNSHGVSPGSSVLEGIWVPHIHAVAVQGLQRSLLVTGVGKVGEKQG